MSKRLAFILLITAPVLVCAQDIQYYQSESIQPMQSQSARPYQSQSVQPSHSQSPRSARSSDIRPYQADQVRHITQRELDEQKRMEIEEARRMVERRGGGAAMANPQAQNWQNQINHRIVEFNNPDVTYHGW